MAFVYLLCRVLWNIQRTAWICVGWKITRVFGFLLFYEPHRKLSLEYLAVTALSLLWWRAHPCDFCAWGEVRERRLDSSFLRCCSPPAFCRRHHHGVLPLCAVGLQTLWRRKLAFPARFLRRRRTLSVFCRGSARRTRELLAVVPA